MTYAELPTKVKPPEKEKSVGLNSKLVEQNLVKWTVYPNPFSHIINVNVNTEVDENAELELYDIYGKNVLSFKQELFSGENNFSFNVDNKLSSGIYFLKIKKKNGQAVWKLSHF